MANILEFLLLAVQGILDINHMIWNISYVHTDSYQKKILMHLTYLLSVNSLFLSGAMIPPLINMYLMEIDFTYFIGTVLTSQLICIVSFFGIWRIGEKLKLRSESENTNDTLLSEKY